MKNIRMEIRIARMKKGVRYTALFNMDPLYGLLYELDGKRVTIKNIRTGIYLADIVESMHPVYLHELSEWREE